MANVPRSALDLTLGMSFFARTLDKIRLQARGELREDFHSMLGKGVDGWCCGFLRVPYEALRERTLAGGTDEEILQWCFATGRELNEVDLMVWNNFVSKLGWNDRATPLLERFKRGSGLAERTEIVTMAEYFEVDEGRKP